MGIMVFWLECGQAVGWDHNRSEIYYLFQFILTLHRNHTNQDWHACGMVKKMQDHTALAADLWLKAPGQDHLFSFTPRLTSPDLDEA
jgi:hypothetical protein